MPVPALEPIAFRVVKNLQTALAAMSIAGDYFYDIAGIAVKLDPDVAVEALVPPGGARPFVVLDVQPDTFEIAGTKPNRATVRMPIDVHWVNDSDPTDDDSWMKTYFRGCRDVERAIAVDISRGGLAFDTRVIGCSATRRGAEVKALVPMLVTVTRVYGQP